MCDRRETLIKSENSNHKLFNLLPSLNNNDFDFRSQSKYILPTFKTNRLN